jgi:hypothetical protein
VLRRVFGPKREEITDERGLHTEELHNLHTSPCIFIVIISKKMRCVGYAAQMMKIRYACKMVSKPQGNGHFRDLSINGRIILKFILEEQGVKVLIGLN